MKYEYDHVLNLGNLDLTSTNDVGILLWYYHASRTYIVGVRWELAASNCSPDYFIYGIINIVKLAKGVYHVCVLPLAANRYQ